MKRDVPFLNPDTDLQGYKLVKDAVKWIYRNAKLFK